MNSGPFLSLILSGALVAALPTTVDAAATCASPVSMQVLGSGGPVPEGDRASSGYLVWVDGHSRLLVDAGGGVFLRFGQAHAHIEDLRAVAITHFHADHVADFPAPVKAGFFSDRSEPLPVTGPTGKDDFPNLTHFLDAEFKVPGGASEYLSGALSGTDGLFKLEPREVKTDDPVATYVYHWDDLDVFAAPVNHGPVPAAGFLVRSHGHSIAFSGDQNGDNPAFWTMVENADLLVMHLAVSQHPDVVAAHLHARPSVIGEHAQQAHVKQVVLSHLMKRSLDTLPDNLREIKKHFSGSLRVAQDLECFKP